MSAKKQTPSDALDLSMIEAAVDRQDEGIDVEIVGLDGETPLGLTIRVAGPDSKRAAAAQDAVQSEMLRKIDPAKGLDQVDMSGATDRGIRYLAMITISWTPSVLLEGNERSYNLANAEMLYKRFKFIRDQVDRAAGDRKRFMTG